MNEVTKQALALLREKLDALIKSATTEGVRVKLRNIDDVCNHLVVIGRQRLTVPSLLSTYAARYPVPDQAIAESSIRNKRAGGNPYQELYRAWESAAEVLLAAAPRSGKTINTEILSEEDLTAVTDHGVRHQVKLLIAQNRSYKSQLDILKKVVGESTINLTASHPDAGSTLPSGTPTKIELTESELAALSDFMAPRRLQSRGLLHADHGVLQVRGDRDLSDPGFLDALQKVLAHLQS